MSAVEHAIMIHPMVSKPFAYNFEMMDFNLCIKSELECESTPMNGSDKNDN